MDLISFGADAGHLADRLARTGAFEEIAPSVFEVRRPALELIQLLREATSGGWTVELLPRGGEPDTGLGWLVKLTSLIEGPAGMFVHGEELASTSSLWFPVDKIEQMHVY